MTSKFRLNELQARATVVWRLACEFDDIDQSATFVTFSENNPYVNSLNDLRSKLGQEIVFLALVESETKGDVTRPERTSDIYAIAQHNKATATKEAPKASTVPSFETWLKDDNAQEIK